MRYCVIMSVIRNHTQEEDHKRFEENVSKAMNSGWMPTGGVSVAYGDDFIQISQALIK